MRTITILSFLVASTMSCKQPAKDEINIDKWQGTNMEKSLFSAMDYADAENYLPAIKLCDSIIAVDSTYDRAYFERGMAYLGLDSTTPAIKDFEKVRRMDPKFPGLRDWYASALADNERYLEAARLKRGELLDYPDGEQKMGVSPFDWTESAEYYYQAGLIDSAIFTLDEYFESYADRVSYYRTDETAPFRLYSELLIEKKEFAEAFKKMEQAMKSEYKVPADYALWIEVNILVGDLNTARQMLDMYIKDVHGGFETEDAKRLRMMME